MSVGKARKDDMSIAKSEKEPAMSVAAKATEPEMSVKAKAFKDDDMSVGKAEKEVMSVGKASKVMSVWVTLMYMLISFAMTYNLSCIACFIMQIRRQGGESSRNVNTNKRGQSREDLFALNG